MAGNRLVVPGVQEALHGLKLEVANELGLHDYDNIDKGALPSRVNGQVGGQMVKRMIELAQNQMTAQQQVPTTHTEKQEHLQ